MKSMKSTFGLLAAGVLLLAGCSAGAPAADSTGEADTARGGTLTLGQLGDLASWDPSQAHVGHALVPYQLVYDTLILREPDGSSSPMLATEWSYNDDRTRLTVDLRTDVSFCDGEPFDAEAVRGQPRALQGGQRSPGRAADRSSSRRPRGRGHRRDQPRRSPTRRWSTTSARPPA